MTENPEGKMTDRIHPRSVREARDAPLPTRPSVRQTTRPSAQMEAVLANLPDGFFLLDPDWRYTYVNAAAARFFQTTPDQLLGRVIWETFPQARQSRLYQEFIRAAEQRVSVEFEEFHDPLGRWYEFRGYPAEDGLAVFLRDLTHHKQTEQALLESRRVLELAITGSNAGLWRIDLDPQRPEVMPDYVYLSPSLKALLGFEDHEFPNSRSAWISRIPAEDLARIQESARAHAEGRTEMHQVDFRIRHKDGSLRWFTKRGRLYRDEYGRPLCWAGIDWDITSGKHAEEELDRARQQWERTFDAVPDLIAIIDPQHRILRANRAMAERLGKTPEQCVGLACYEWVHGLDAPPGYCPHELALADGREHTVEVYEKRLNGYFLVSCTPLLDREGQVVGTVHVARDITQRRRMEEDLRRLKERAERVARKSAWLARIPQENPDPIIRVSTDHVILYGNPAAEELYRQWGCSKRQTVPTPVQEAVAAALAGGAVSRCEISWNSHTFWLTVAPFPTQGYVTVYVKDVTERKHLEAQLQQANEHLEAQVAARTAELTRTIEQLHEEVAQRIRVEAERQKAFSELQERARQLQQLMLELSQTEDRERRRLAEILHDDLQQLLAAAKFHLGLLDRCLRTDPEAQDLAATAKDLLKQAIDQSRSLSHELSPPGLSHSDLCETFEWLAREVQAKHGLTVHLETLPRIELHSEPLKTFLYRTAQEMLFNVVKHAHAPEARLRLRRRRGRIYLSVADRGCGFDPQRAGKAGFGLRSVRERVELLGGRMRMRSAAGKGSVFVLAVPDPGPGDEATGAREEGKKGRGEEGRGGLPSALPPLFPSYPPTLLPSSSLPPPAPLRVLLVDDHRIVRQGIKAMLAGEQDLTVVGEADNGREAVDLAYRLEPHVIVMDVAMPVMAGDEAARQIRRRLPRTRIIALSMFDNARVADRMRQAGAAAYLLKTAPAEELLAAIRGREAVAPEP